MFPACIDAFLNVIGTCTTGFHLLTGWTIRIMAVIVLCCFILATLTIKARRPATPLPTMRKLIDFSAFRDPCYAALALGCWFSIFSLFNPYFYVGQYSAVSNEASHLRSYFLTIMCTSSIVGRVLPGFFADAVGRYVNDFTTFFACYGLPFHSSCHHLTYTHCGLHTSL